jgi:hypothetical protein
MTGSGIGGVAAPVPGVSPAETGHPHGLLTQIFLGYYSSPYHLHAERVSYMLVSSGGP